MNINDIFKYMQGSQEEMLKGQENIKNIKVEGSSGVGLVKVTITGTYEMYGLTIDPSIFSKEEKEVVEDLIIEAYRDAHKKLTKRIQEETQNLMTGLTPDSLSNLFGK